MMGPALLVRPPMLRWIGAAIAAGALLAAMGPFGSYANRGPVQLAGYWIAATLLGLALYGSAFGIVRALARKWPRLWWPSLIGATLLASVPETLATRAAAFWLWPELARLHLPLPLWFGQTAMMGLFVMLGMGLIAGRSAPAPRDDPAPLPSLQRETVPLGRDVLALQMEDHYVRVHRPDRSELILMPLGQAIERVETEGLRTHRSWWVASHAVVAVEGNRRAMRLHLSSGVVAPVARSAVIHLKAAGWIAEGDSEAGFRERTASS